MARLGRGRRSGARIARARSVTTATPLVRRRLVIEQDGANGAWRWYGRIKRGRRPKAIVVRAPSVTTPTPLVKKRLVQTPVANDRAMFYARFFRRKRAHIATHPFRSPPAAPVYRPALPSIARTKASRTRFFRRHALRLARGVSAVTPTPLIRNRAWVDRNAWRIAQRRLRSRSKVITRALSVPTPTPYVHRSSVVVANARRAVRLRALGWRGLIIRRPAVATVAAAPTVVRSRVLVRMRRLVLRRRRARIVRPAFVPGAQLRRAPVVEHQRTAVQTRARRRRKATVMRSPIVGVRAGNRPLVVVGRNRRKPAQVRTFFARHRAHFETNTLGSAGAPVVIVIGQFDAAQASGGDDAGAATASRFDSATPGGGDDAAPALATSFDAGQPGVTA